MISISQFSNLSRIIRELENSDFLKVHNEFQSAKDRDINYKEGSNQEYTAFDSGDMESIQYDEQERINQDSDHSKKIEKPYKEEIEVKTQRGSQFPTDLSSKKLKEGIIWSELLGPPLSKRRRNK